MKEIKGKLNTVQSVIKEELSTAQITEKEQNDIKKFALQKAGLGAIYFINT